MSYHQDNQEIALRNLFNQALSKKYDNITLELTDHHEDCIYPFMVSCYKTDRKTLSNNLCDIICDHTTGRAEIGFSNFENDLLDSSTGELKAIEECISVMFPLFYEVENIIHEYKDKLKVDYFEPKVKE